MPVVLHAVTSLTWPWLLAAGVGVFCLLAAGTLALWARSQAKSAPKVGEAADDYSPAGRRKRMDDLFYPPRDDRLELGEQCAAFATKAHVFNEENEWRRERTVARYAREFRDADPDKDPRQAREEAESLFARNVEGEYARKLREEALRLFDQAYEQGKTRAKARRMVEHPLAVEMGEIPNLFAAFARRLGYEPIINLDALGPPPDDLRSRLDDLMREGIGLVAEFSAPVEPQKAKGGSWYLEGGDAPDEWWDKAEDFAKRIRQLLIDRHPALLTDYRDGYNAHVRKEGKERKASDPAQDKRSVAAKMLDFANFERSGPRRVTEASLEGLAAARHRVGGEQSTRTI